MSSDPTLFKSVFNRDPLDTPMPDHPPEDSTPFNLPIVLDLPVFFHPTVSPDLARFDGPVPSKDIQSNPVIQQPPGQAHGVTSQGFFPTVGRLYILNGTEWQHGTAQFVGSPDVILTAAHCVFDTWSGRFFDDALFYANYADGHYTSGHRWQCAAVYNGWAQGDWYYDFAFIKLRTPSPGTTLLGLQPNSGREPMTSVGYPENYDGGRSAFYVNGPIGPVPVAVSGEYPGILIMQQNDFQGGSSGGAWVYDQYAESINSFRIPGCKFETTMCGPQFGPSTQKLYQYVNNKCRPVLSDSALPLAAGDACVRPSALKK